MTKLKAAFRAKQRAERIKEHYWNKAVEFDGIDSGSARLAFVVFSDENPFVAGYDKAVQAFYRYYDIIMKVGY